MTRKPQALKIQRDIVILVFCGFWFRAPLKSISTMFKSYIESIFRIPYTGHLQNIGMQYCVTLMCSVVQYPISSCYAVLLKWQQEKVCMGIQCDSPQVLKNIQFVCVIGVCYDVYVWDSGQVLGISLLPFLISGIQITW